jgi:hypothetical protein
MFAIAPGVIPRPKIVYKMMLGCSCFEWVILCVVAIENDQVQTYLATWLTISFLLKLLQKSLILNYLRFLSYGHQELLLHFQISATDARALGIGAALVEILAQERRTCEYYHVPERLQPALSNFNGRLQDHAAECCGCIHQDSKGSGTIYLLWWFFYYNFNCTVCLSISLSEINSLQGRRQHCHCGWNTK